MERRRQPIKATEVGMGGEEFGFAFFDGPAP
jgi:hypothetical protein